VSFYAGLGEDSVPRKTRVTTERGGGRVHTEAAPVEVSSFYDGESVEHHEEYAGERVERGLFEASDGTQLNADVNGAVNMVRKSTGKPNSDLFESAEGVERALKETSLETPSSRKPPLTAE
jgi:hypothetical protein